MAKKWASASSLSCKTPNRSKGNGVSVKKRGDDPKLGSLKETNAKLYDEAAELRLQTSELRKNVSSLSSQLSETLTDKQDLSRKFWDVTEDCKELREKLENDQVTRVNEEKERASLNDKISDLETALDARNEQHKIQLCEAKAQMQLDIQALCEKKESEMNVKFNDMQERIGGMEDALDLTRGELCSVEAERGALFDRTQTLTARLNEMSGIVSESQARIDQLESVNMTTSEMLKKKDEAFQRQLGEIDKLRIELTSCRQQRDKGNAMATAAKEEHIQAVQACQDEIYKLRTDISSLSSSKNLSDELIIELKKEIDIIKHGHEIDAQKMKRKFSDVEVRLEGSKKRNAGLREELEKYVQKLEDERKQRNLAETNLLTESKNLAEREKLLQGSLGSLDEGQKKLKAISSRCSTLEVEKSDLLTEEKVLTAKLHQLAEERDMWVADLHASQAVLAKVEQEHKDELSRGDCLRSDMLKDKQESFEKEKMDIEMACIEKIRVLKVGNLKVVEEINCENEKLQNELSASEGEVNRLQEEVESVTFELRSQIESQDASRKARTDLEKRHLEELSSQQAKIDDMSDKLARAGCEVHRVLTKLETTNVELSDSTSQFNTILNEKDRLEAIVNEYEHKTDLMRKEIETATKYASDLREENIRLAESMRSAKRAYSELMKRLTTEAKVFDESINKEREELNESQLKLEQHCASLARKDANFAKLKSKSKAAVDHISSELSHVSFKFEEERDQARKEKVKLRSRIYELDVAAQTANSRHVSDMDKLNGEIEGRNHVIAKLRQDNQNISSQLGQNKIGLKRLSDELMDLRDHTNDVEYRLELCQKRALLLEEMNEEMSHEDCSDHDETPITRKSLPVVDSLAKVENDSTGVPDIASTVFVGSDKFDDDHEVAKWPCTSRTREEDDCNDQSGDIRFPSVVCTNDIDDVGSIMNKTVEFLKRKQRQLGVEVRNTECDVGERKENVNINEITLPKIKS